MPRKPDPTLPEELEIYAAQLRRQTANARLAGPGVMVRVADPDYLADLLERALAAL